MISRFLDIETYLFKFVALNKSIRDSTAGQKGNSEIYWKNMFAHEFCHPIEAFPDFKKEDNELFVDAFKRAFGLYKDLRKLLKEMLHQTARCLSPNMEEQGGEKYDELVKYVSNYSMEGRCLKNTFIASAINFTLEFICFHKNLNDMADNIDC